MLGLKMGWMMAVSTNILPDNMTIEELLLLVVKILVYGLGVAAVIGVVWAGILYQTARDNEGQVAKAKTRLLEVVIGMVVWAVMFTALNWLIPGFSGLNPSSTPKDDTSEVDTSVPD